MAKAQNIILGAGLAGLSAGYALKKQNKGSLILEKEPYIGGLSTSIKHNGFIFDLGGHRFHTKDEKILGFVKNLTGKDLLLVHRKSHILLGGKFFDYPLKATNAIFSMGFLKTIEVLFGYVYSFIAQQFSRKPDISFEDWIVKRFGSPLYEIYFKPYTEKTWGIPCNQISADWAKERIGLISLREIAKHMFFKLKDKPKTLTDKFYYPKKGIIQLSEKLAKNQNIKLNSNIIKIKHKNNKISSVVLKGNKEIKCDNIISTIPLTTLVNLLNPMPPKEILGASNKLKFRAQVIVFLMLNKEKVNDDSWIYFPEKNICFGRLHEPKNWSQAMVPENKTSLVLEFFCNKDDQVWNMTDKEIITKSITDLKKINFIKKQEVIGAFVKRIDFAYPIFTVGYEKYLKIVKDYLSKFENLRSIGRNGTFSYLNMDAAIRAGLDV